MARLDGPKSSDDGDADASALLAAAAAGDPTASAQLLPLVYDHLRELARKRLAHERPGLTLDATALVHEAYMRIAGGGDVQWNSRRHFFAAAGIAMRRILVERARRLAGPKAGGGRQRLPLSAVNDPSLAQADPVDETDWILLDEALTELEQTDPELSEVVHLRYFAGLTVPEAAMALNRGARSVDRDWSVARAWLLDRMKKA
jgi:RNA polymerase sigma factor (TIGR02999 family)